MSSHELTRFTSLVDESLGIEVTRVIDELKTGSSANCMDYQTTNTNPVLRCGKHFVKGGRLILRKDNFWSEAADSETAEGKH